MVFRELSFSRLECGVHDRLHICPLCGIFYFPWHRHQIEGTNGFYCLIRKTERFTISNVESQVFTPNNSRLDPGSNPGWPRDKRMSYHWTNCASCRYVFSAPHAGMFFLRLMQVCFFCASCRYVFSVTHCFYHNNCLLSIFIGQPCTRHTIYKSFKIVLVKDACNL